MVSQTLADLEERPEIIPSGAAHALALVRRPRELVQVASHGAQFRDGPLERQEFLFRQRRKRSKMGPNQHRDVGGRRQPTGSRSLP